MTVFAQPFGILWNDGREWFRQNNLSTSSAGILTPDKGSIKLDGQDLTKLNVVKGLLQNIINRIHLPVIQFTSRFNMFGKSETTHVFSSKFDEEYAEELLVR